jgi:tRNA(Ile)-lysidine synthase
MLLPGRPVRGGGRAAGEELALDVTRLVGLATALQRRLLRYCAERLGAAPDFPATEALRALALHGRAGQKLELAQGLRAERTHRELRLSGSAAGAGKDEPGVASTEGAAAYTTAIPGEIVAPAFGLRLRIGASALPAQNQEGSSAPAAVATLRNWKPGDRVMLRYSSGPRKIKEVLERLRVTGSSRAFWPVLEIAGRIVWMRGAELEPAAGISIVAENL